jgi:hypothetical protein
VDFTTFIDRVGTRHLSLVLNVSPTTIYAWKFNNLIPRRHWPEVMLAWPTTGLRDLLEMERHATPRANDRQSA